LGGGTVAGARVPEFRSRARKRANGPNEKPATAGGSGRPLALLALGACLATTATAATPVRLADGLLDQSVPHTLGLSAIPATFHTIYHAAAEEFRFNHQPNLAVYRDRLYAIWTNGSLSENDNGQRVLWSVSDDGVHWQPWSILADDPDGSDGPFFAVATGLHTHADTLVAYVAHIRHPEPPTRDASIHALVTTDGATWSERRKLFPGYGIEGARALPSGRLLMPGQLYPIPEGLIQPPPRVMYSDNPDGLSGWTNVNVPPFGEFEERFPEGNWFLRADGAIGILWRAPKEVPWLYASVSTDDGLSWSAPVRTNLPSATSRMATGNLPDGRAYCVWNPSQRFGRNPLVIALSDDGLVFDRAWVLRGEAAKRRFGGVRKSDGWQYPMALVWRDALWVIHSVNKEDIALARIRLEDLQ
jgi:hypothetical protein